MLSFLWGQNNNPFLWYLRKWNEQGFTLYDYNNVIKDISDRFVFLDLHCTYTFVFSEDFKTWTWSNIILYMCNKLQIVVLWSGICVIFVIRFGYRLPKSYSHQNVSHILYIILFRNIIIFMVAYIYLSTED